MGLIPGSRELQIEFFEQRKSSWTTNAAAIGLSPSQMTALTTRITNARKASDDAKQARINSTTLTQEFYGKTGEMRELGADYLATIKAYAETTNNPNVYTLAEIPPPSGPTTQPLPKPPVDIRGTLDMNGRLTLRWKANPDGPDTNLYYIIERRIVGESGVPGPWSILGGNGKREFVDTTLPACINGAQYRITTRRLGTASDPSSTFEVVFGQGAGAGLTLVSSGMLAEAA